MAVIQIDTKKAAPERDEYIDATDSTLKLLTDDQYLLGQAPPAAAFGTPPGSALAENVAAAPHRRRARKRGGGKSARGAQDAAHDYATWPDAQSLRNDLDHAILHRQLAAPALREREGRERQAPAIDERGVAKLHELHGHEQATLGTQKAH